MINAAGGGVKNVAGDILFIFRNGKWDLPKGKIEEGEETMNAAMREVREECGISDVAIVRELISTYHTYNVLNKRILKKTVWFEMFCKDSAELKPQIEEGITMVKWMNKDETLKALNNTYESVKEVIAIL